MIATCSRRTTPVTTGRVLHAAALACGAALLVAGAAGAQTPGLRVRGLDPRAAGLLEQGPVLSPTFARLLDTLERSDVIVYVKTSPLRGRGQLQIAAALPSSRFLWITIDALETERELLATLAHELHHAVEVAGAPGITDGATLARFYREHGYQNDGRSGYCTHEAVRAASRVRDEVREARPLAIRRSGR